MNLAQITLAQNNIASNLNFRQMSSDVIVIVIRFLPCACAGWAHCMVEASEAMTKLKELDS